MDDRLIFLYLVVSVINEVETKKVKCIRLLDMPVWGCRWELLANP